MERKEFYQKCLEDCDKVINDIHRRTDISDEQKWKIIDGLLENRKIILDLLLDNI